MAPRGCVRVHARVLVPPNLLVALCSAAAPCDWDWAAMVGLIMPAPAVDDVHRRPSPNARPVARGRAGGCSCVGSPRSTLMDDGRALWPDIGHHLRGRSHNTAGGAPAHGARIHRRGGQQTPTAGGHNTRTHHRGGQQAPTPQGGTTPQGGGPPGGHNTAGGTSTQEGRSHPPTESLHTYTDTHT